MSAARARSGLYAVAPEREPNRERRGLSLDAAHVHCAAMLLEDKTDPGQADTSAADRARDVGAAVVGIEDTFQIGGPNPDSSVLHGQDSPGAVPVILGRCTHGDLAVRVVVLDRVRK